MATPARYHWYVSVTGDGPHVPGLAVSVEPTLRVPEIVGVAEVRSPAIAAVLADALSTVVYPVLLPMTCTVSVLPRSEVVSV